MGKQVWGIYDKDLILGQSQLLKMKNEWECAEEE